MAREELIGARRHGLHVKQRAEYIEQDGPNRHALSLCLVAFVVDRRV
jgi:hypothetical protein